MNRNKRKGYDAERKIRLMFEKEGWKVIRSGGSLGEADLACFLQGKCVFLQVKSTKKNAYYYPKEEHQEKELCGFPFFLIVDFGYGRIRILPPQWKVSKEDGVSLVDFLAFRTDFYFEDMKGGLLKKDEETFPDKVVPAGERQIAGQGGVK